MQLQYNRGINRRHLEWGVLACIILAAAFLRFASPGIVEFKRDEANLSLLALDVAHGVNLPLLGIGSSTGFPNAPVNVYVLSLPYLFSSNPLYATAFIALLNVLAVLLVYLFGRVTGGPLAGIIAAALFAFSPWAIIFSRKIWAQNMLPVFIMLLMLTGVYGFIHGKRWGQWLHVPLLAVTGQIHYGAFVMIPASLSLMYSGRHRLGRGFYFGLCLTALITLPYVLGLVHYGWMDPARLSSARGDDVHEVRLSAAAWEGAWLTMAGTEIHSLAGPETFRDYLAQVPNAYGLFYIIALVLIASSAWLIIRCARWPDARTPVDLALLLWLIFPPLAFTFTWTPFYTHYLIPMLPAAFLTIGFATQDVWRFLAGYMSVRRIIFAVGGVTLAAILLFQAIMWLSLLQFLDSRYTPGGFGTPLHYLDDVRSVILAENPVSVLVGVGGDAVEFDDEPTVWAALLYDVSDVRFHRSAIEVHPSARTLYLTSGCPDVSLDEDMIFHLRDDEGCYWIETRSSDDLDTTDFMPLSTDDAPVKMANGVTLTAYYTEYGPQSPCLSLVWEIERMTSEDYFFAVNFLNSDGERMAQADALSWWGRYWRPGDIVLSEFCAPEFHDDVVSIGVGMYTYDGLHFDNVDFLDEAGNPAGQIRELPLSMPDS